MKKNTLYYGDCLEVMKEWPDNAVDLIYLDPPFNSKVNYNILFGTGKVGKTKDDLAQLTAFTDTWQWDEDAQRRVALIESAIDHPAHNAIIAFNTLYPDGSGMLSYLSYMAERLAVMQQLLKPNGSIYLHCDPTASHYLKIIMDNVFGKPNFRNELIWCYAPTGKYPKYAFPHKHDVILFYSGNNATFIPQYGAITPATRRTYSVKTDKDGRLYGIAHGKRMYLDENKGRPIPSWWPDIAGGSLMSANERLGYPTQKPLALLERIVKSSSNEGDVVLDPFCGCGTTIEAAHNLKRDWIGIDNSPYAIELTRNKRMIGLNIPLEQA